MDTKNTEGTVNHASSQSFNIPEALHHAQERYAHRKKKVSLKVIDQIREYGELLRGQYKLVAHPSHESYIELLKGQDKLARLISENDAIAATNQAEKEKLRQEIEKAGHGELLRLFVDELTLGLKGKDINKSTRA